MRQDEELEGARTGEAGEAGEASVPGARRHLIDGQGDAWEVYEFGARGRLDRDRPRVLIFETSSRWRRVKSYPADWADLPDAELLALSRYP